MGALWIRSILESRECANGGGVTASALRALTGVAFVAAIVAVVALAATMFRGGFSDSVSVTVISPRAGLVMNPDAKVQIRGVQVGKVDSIEQLPNGEAAIHLAMDPKRLDAVPANVLVDVASTTVFGAKQVQLVFPPDPSAESLRAGQVLAAQHVMVEINTVFEQLTTVLSRIDPPKLNETLGAIASAVDGRGEKFGQMLTDLDAYLAKIEPTLPALSHDLETAPGVLRASATSRRTS
jgi:phospholipid/cholesterol/gamma-HCH transport system substrate-binding protein